MTDTNGFAIAFSAGASATVFIFSKVYAMVREQKNSNGRPKTFAQDPERYWDSMRENVTKPLTEVMDRQTRILEDQTKVLTRLEDRTRRQ